MNTNQRAPRCPIGYCDTAHSPAVTCYQAVSASASPWATAFAIASLMLVSVIAGAAFMLDVIGHR